MAGVRSGVADGGRAGEERIQEPLQFTEPGAVQSQPSLGDWEQKDRQHRIHSTHRATEQADADAEGREGFICCLWFGTWEGMPHARHTDERMGLNFAFGSV